MVLTQEARSSQRSAQGDGDEWVYGLWDPTLERPSLFQFTALPILTPAGVLSTISQGAPIDTCLENLTSQPF